MRRRSDSPLIETSAAHTVTARECPRAARARKRPRSTATTWDDLPLLLTMRQVMEVLGISKGVAYALAHQDRFPAVWMTDRVVRVPRDGLRQWVESRGGEHGTRA